MIGVWWMVLRSVFNCPSGIHDFAVVVNWVLSSTLVFFVKYFVLRDAQRNVDNTLLEGSKDQSSCDLCLNKIM